VKTTKLFFRGPIELVAHESFAAAAKAGHCAYRASIEELYRGVSYPFCLRSPRLRKLRRILLDRSIL
jgi:hypothetical protein